MSQEDAQDLITNKDINIIFGVQEKCTLDLYFVSPRERPRRQRVVQNNTLVIARVTPLCFLTRSKRNPGIDSQMMRFAVFIL